MIVPEKFTYDGIISALEKGEMYASMGPVFKEISLEGDTLLTKVDVAIHPEAKYVRVSIFDLCGRAADTRGYFREELGLPPLGK